MKHCHQLLTVLVLFFVVQKTTGLCKEDERKLRCVEDLSCRLKGMSVTELRSYAAQHHVDISNLKVLCF